MSEPRVTAVVGCQFGSEAKGAKVCQIMGDYRAHVRVGAANAGHTGYINGRKVVAQQLPMAAWAGPGFNCYIGPGAVISLEILEREIQESGIDDSRLFIDHRAHVITGDQIRREAESDLAARIGSTSTIAREGIGVATADRVLRRADCVPASEHPDLQDYMCDVPMLLADERTILLEGTQGLGLSLTTGYFPYTTSRNVSTAGMMADAGVSPRRLTDVIGVFRTYPIRVAGNSGPFPPDSQEVDFDYIGVPPERTTVTQLVRRIGTFSDEQVRAAKVINGVDEAHLAFFDYVVPESKGLSNWSDLSTAAQFAARRWRGAFQDYGIRLVSLGTGPASIINMPTARGYATEQVAHDTAH